MAGPTEPQLMRFGLRDGMANSFGAQVIVCDTNGVPDGAIHARVSYHGLSGESALWHAAGKYVWKVTATNGADLASATFTVTPPESTVCITGAVKVVTSLDPLMGTPLPGALVTADMHSYCQGYLPAVWADPDGYFLLPVPAGISNDNVQSVSAVAFGYCMAENGPEGVGSLSTVPLQEVLQAGTNALSQPLYVVPAVPGMVYSLSGHVYDLNTNALAGVMVKAETDDSDVYSVVMTDSNGAYTALMPGMSERETIVYSLDPVLNMRGRVGSGINAGVVTSDLSGLDLYLPPATTLVKGQVQKAEGPNGLMGVGVSLGRGVSYSFDDEGNFEIGMVGGSNLQAKVDTDSLKPLHRFSPETVATNITLPSSGVWTNLTIPVVPAWVVTGGVYDQETNALSGGWVWANLDGRNFDSVMPNLAGYYELLLPANDYQMGTWSYFDFGYIDGNYPGPVTVLSNDVGGVNFYLSQSAVISGQVLGDGLPVEYAGVGAAIPVSNGSGGTNWMNQGWRQTDSNGFYIITVPPGTPYLVVVEPPWGSSWLKQFYSNATDEAHATLVTPYIDVAATNIDFVLQQGAWIRGRVVSGGVPVEYVDVQAGLVTTNEWGYLQWQHVSSDNTDSNGDYALIVPPGVAHTIGAALDQNVAPRWLDQYYSNCVDISEAALVTATTNTPAEDINFDLIPAMRIAGWVWDPTNSPLRDAEGNVINANVQVGMFDGEGNWMTTRETWTDQDGQYFIKCEAGSNHVVRVSQWGFAQVYYHDKLSGDGADIVSAGQGETVGNVNFTLYDETADSDLDGMPDYLEGYVAGTNPFDSNDVLRCTGVEISNTHVSVFWSAVDSKSYILQRTTDLLNPEAWTNVTPVPVTAEGSSASFTDSNAPAGSSYRLVLPY